ncbi:J domain-containing protein [Arthrobacter sp. NPDC057009]|uniref:J domain-containing protein n=1 Tax=Arthrobacter sp. NPDC057009 TaxID=3345996 RepID=UPI00362CBA8E
MTSPSPDYYAVLQIPKAASQQEIARAYRTQMRRHHPDVASGEGVPAELQLVMQAFAVLRDPKRRAAYDREVLAAAAREPAGAQPSASKAQDIPVHVVRHREPPLRVTPVRWESGPWA